MPTKISELTSATALDGSELLPVVQGGVTKQATIDDLVSTGTWSPTVYGQVTPGTYTTTSTIATYSKVGKQVTLSAKIEFSAASGGSGNCMISNLPYPIDGTNVQAVLGTFASSNFNFLKSSTTTMITIFPLSTTELAPLESEDNVAWQASLITGVSTSTILRFNMTYITT
jgi:hypothetical protein